MSEKEYNLFHVHVTSDQLKAEGLLKGLDPEKTFACGAVEAEDLEDARRVALDPANAGEWTGVEVLKIEPADETLMILAAIGRLPIIRDPARQDVEDEEDVIAAPIPALGYEN